MSYAWAEWLVAVRRRRTFALSVLVPAGMIAILVFSAAPTFHASVVATVLFAFFGTFGSAIPIVRDLETGRFSRLLHAGASPGALLSQRVLVSAALDFVQLFCASALILLTHNRSATPALLVALFATLLFSNTMGTWIGTLTRSIGEAALLSSVLAMLLLHAAGVFRTPVPGGWGATLQAFSPFAFLHNAIQASFGIVASPPTSRTISLVLVVAISFASLAILPRATRLLSTSPRR
ncbi:MAG: ABC transporter permease [Longimicrobiales bacterium]